MDDPSGVGEKGRPPSRQARRAGGLSLGRASLRLVWLALPLSLAASCGGTTTDADGSGGTAADGTGGEDGDAAGGAGVDDGTGGLTASGGTDGDPSGGTSSGGASTGGEPGDGSGGDDTGSGGFAGAPSSEHLVELGDSCDTPATFACSAENELLAMICSADGEWEARETCEVGEVCDSVNDLTAGTCRVVLEECEAGSDEPFCGEAGIEACLPGGFETEVLDACGEDDICHLSGCIPPSDPCPSAGTVGCGDACDLATLGCLTNTTCDIGLQLYFEGDSVGDAQIARLPDQTPCVIGSGECPGGESFEIMIDPFSSGVVEETWIRVTMKPGWEMLAKYDDDTGEFECRGESDQECLILPPPVGAGNPGVPERWVKFYPLTDPPVARNVRFEVVPEGTTCD